MYLAPTTTNQNELNKNRAKQLQRFASYLVLFSWLDKRGTAEETCFWGKRLVQVEKISKNGQYTQNN
jgi:hypothetical protein